MRSGKWMMVFAVFALVAVPVGGAFAAGDDAHDKSSKQHTVAATFNHDIAPIVFSHCSSCHHPGQVAPFPLLSYADVKKRGTQIGVVIKSGYMPPWKAKSDCDFRDNRSLSPSQVELFEKWIETGMPEGKSGERKKPPVYVGGWTLGPPDLIVKMPRAYHVPAEGPDIYRNFVVPLNLPSDVYVRAIDFEPGARAVVHHSLFFYDATGNARSKEPTEGQPGFSGAMGSFLSGGKGLGPQGILQILQKFQSSNAGAPIGSLGGWAVGAQPVFLPNGLAYKLPKDADLILSTHFHPSGKVEEEQSSVGLYFTKIPPEKQFAGVQLPPLFGIFSGLDIPAGEKSYLLEDSFTLPVDVNAFGVGAHAHYLGREMVLTATLPDGSMRSLLNISDWDFNWQDQYVYQKDVMLPAGTVLHARLSYDNSSSNPRNPTNPPRRVKWGEQTTDEMGSVMLHLTAVKESDLPILEQAYGAHIREALMKRRRRIPAGVGPALRF